MQEKLRYFSPHAAVHERREISPHIWQITESRVHIGGRALLFKNIGQQEDEIKSDWKPSTAKTLEEAAKQLGAG